MIYYNCIFSAYLFFYYARAPTGRGHKALMAILYLPVCPVPDPSERVSE